MACTCGVAVSVRFVGGGLALHCPQCVSVGSARGDAAVEVSLIGMGCRFWH
jgi:hypothetical protein